MRPIDRQNHSVICVPGRFAGMDKYEIIVNAEAQFAREVTIGVIYLRPVPVWQYLIPGMFLIDFLRRGSAIRKYTDTFMFPRNLALQAARNLSAGQTRAAIEPHLEAEIKNWLASHHLDSPGLVKAQKATVDLLIDHYGKLLQAEGNSYYDLIQNTYPSRESYENYLDQITANENEVDQAILETVGEQQKVKEKLQLEARQVQVRRQKILEDIY
jgi:hypothetical protein